MTAQWADVCASGASKTIINLSTNGTKTYSYTGKPECMVFIKTGNYKFELWGAQGGQYLALSKGGNGAYTAGQINISKAMVLYAYIGEMGKAENNNSHDSAPAYNGGGRGGSNAQYNSASGGGATDIRFFNTIPTSDTLRWDAIIGLRGRIMVSAGGGGGLGSSSGTLTSTIANGVGGTITGTLGQENCCSNGNQKAATQISGGITPNIKDGGENKNGSFGQGPQVSYLSGWGGGGGGGWYGGATGHGSGGQGGSSYISGHAGSIAVTSVSSTVAKCTSGSPTVTCSQSWTGYTFTSTQMIAGNASMPSPTSTSNETGHTGNGYARITYLGT